MQYEQYVLYLMSSNVFIGHNASIYSCLNRCLLLLV